MFWIGQPDQFRYSFEFVRSHCSLSMCIVYSCFDSYSSPMSKINTNCHNLINFTFASEFLTILKNVSSDDHSQPSGHHFMLNGSPRDVDRSGHGMELQGAVKLERQRIDTAGSGRILRVCTYSRKQREKRLAYPMKSGDKTVPRE